MRAKRARGSGIGDLQALEHRRLFSSFSPVSPPVTLSAVARSATIVQLNWNADLTVGETGFLVERSTDNATWGQAVITPPNAQAWLDTAAEPNTHYFYRVAAMSSFGFFYADENPAQVTTPGVTVVQSSASGSTFITRTNADDLVVITDSLTQYDITVDGVLHVVDPSRAQYIGILRTTSDNGVTLDSFGSLVIRGTLESDTFGLSADNSYFFIRMNDAQVNISRSLVHRITILTYAGDDRISIGDNVGAVNINSGDGNDTIYSNTGDDRLDGGAGDDLIKGNAGDDRIYGGSGDDTMYGQGGNDFMQGGNGNDRMIGGVGNDVMYGENGNDRLYGEDGIDLLDGGLGFNLLKQDSP